MRGRKPDPAKARMGRLRVCTACVAPTDAVFGPVRGQLPCDRCGASPCSGAIVEPNSALGPLVGKAVRPMTEVPPEPPPRPKPALVDLSTVPKALKPPGYMAPEQHVPRVDVAVDEADDVELGPTPEPAHLVHRVRPPNGEERQIDRVVQAWREMEASGQRLTRRDFAAKLGMTQVNVSTTMYYARKEGLLRESEGRFLPQRRPASVAAMPLGVPSVDTALRAEIEYHEARARLLRGMLAQYEGTALHSATESVTVAGTERASVLEG